MIGPQADRQPTTRGNPRGFRVNGPRRPAAEPSGAELGERTAGGRGAPGRTAGPSGAEPGPGGRPRVPAELGAETAAGGGAGSRAIGSGAAELGGPAPRAARFGPVAFRHRS